MKKIKLQRNPGFTIIEALTMLFIFSLITVTFYNVISLGTSYIMLSKNRLGAIALAREKMETIRNLDYEEIGVEGGDVPGDIIADENIVKNAKQYNVKTDVSYVLDSYDGDFPTDTDWNDYKSVTITIAWDGGGGGKEIKINSLFSPNNLEFADPDSRILSINIFSDQPGGSGIENATVQVVNSDTSLNTTKYTDSNGNITLSGDNIKDSIQKYEITVSKSDYETIETMPPYPATAYNPVDIHASVVPGIVNVVNIIQNKLADLEVSTVDYLDQPIADVDFSIEGGRILGMEVIDPFNPIYNLNEDTSTNSSGEKDFGEVSPGQYTLSFPSLPSGYSLIETIPFSPFYLLSDDVLNAKVKLARDNQTSLLVKIIEGVDDGPPLLGVDVRLQNGTDYDETITTTESGAAFFPINSDPFLPGTYNLKISKTGYAEENYDVTINENELKTETVIMEIL